MKEGTMIEVRTNFYTNREGEFYIHVDNFRLKVRPEKEDPVVFIEDEDVVKPTDINEKLIKYMDKSIIKPKSKKKKDVKKIIKKKIKIQEENKDSDEDGINDQKDMCPNTPFGVVVNKDGCPLDSDGDGIDDYKDRCANTPIRAKVDKYGCEIKRVAKKFLNVDFLKNSTRLTYDSFSEVLRFSDFLKKYPKYDAQIIAYSYNDIGIELAKNRAKAIKEALIVEGVDASRLEVFAYSKNILTQQDDTIKTIIEVKIFY